MQCNFEVKVVKSKAEALRVVNEFLEFYSRQGRTVPTVIAAQCSSKAAGIEGLDLAGKLSLPALRLFPVVKVPSNHSDSQYVNVYWRLPQLLIHFA